MKRPDFSRFAAFTTAFLAVFAVPALYAQAQNSPPRKKLIEVGWDQPDTAQLRASHRKMEATTPFDGVMYTVQFTVGKRVFNDSSVLGPPTWKREWLKDAVADMQTCRFSQFTDNFIRVNTAPGNLRWDDDKAWASAAANLGHLAWFAKRTHTKGIIFDPECYAASQYRWDAQSGLSFEKAAALARRRGAAAMRAMAAEYPDITFLSFWLLSLNSSAAKSDDPLPALKGDPYGLWPAFVAGLVEGAAPQTRLVDACENGYYVDDRSGYLGMYNRLRSANGPLRRLLPPELREKYNRQVTAGFGFYLDRYVNRPTDTYYIAPLPGGTALERLGGNLGAAMDITDEYVWAYGEQSRWWNPPTKPDVRLLNTVGKGRLWEETLPGITAALNAVRDPQQALRQAVARRAPAKNRAVNPGMDQETPADAEGAGTVALDWKGGVVPGFSQWQDEKSKGAFLWDRANRAAKMQGVSDGCFIQKYRVKPGEKFFLEVEGKGAGVRLLMARWQTADGDWVSWDEDAAFAFARQPDSETERARGLVTVPERAGLLVVLLVVQNQKKEEVCWFDNLGVYRLSDLF